MRNNKPLAIVGGIIFLLLALVSLYRLLFWFPITIGGEHIGQTASFIGFAVFAALSMIMFRGARTSGES
jgi:hypothetical protein